MESLEITINIFCLLFGYFFGSINPGYFFGRLKKIDIREVGSKNAGTTNTFQMLGVKYGIPTAIFDISKGLLVIVIALSLGTNVVVAHLSGLMTIVGHIFPFYLRFKGGQGVGAATGMLLCYLANYLITKPEFIFFLLYLILLSVIFYYISRIGTLLSIVVLPLLGYSIYIYFPDCQYNFFFWVVIAHITTIGIYNILKEGKFKIEDTNFQTYWWRVAIRPFAIIFLISYIIFTKVPSLLILGSVTLALVAFDIFRLMHKKTNEVLKTKVKALLRKNEIKTFSSFTIFFVALFITLLIFPKEVAFVASSFLIYGDIFGKLFGLAFGKHKILNKTLEGTLAYIGSVLIMGYILYTSLNIPLTVLIIGGISAPLVELFSMKINDNLTVPLMTGSIMTVALLLGL
jgi:glycerol-3-phosphate acyltransferase PlsY